MPIPREAFLELNDLQPDNDDQDLNWWIELAPIIQANNMEVDSNPQSSTTLSLGIIDLSEGNAVSDGSIQGPQQFHQVVPNLNQPIVDNMQADALIEDAEVNL